MASTRLTTSIREHIAKLALSHRFADELMALVADRAAFAEAVYRDIYKQTEREKMAALPEGWLPTVNHIDVQFGEGCRYLTLWFNGSFYGDLWWISTPVEVIFKAIPFKHQHGCVKVYEPTHKLSVRFEELDARLTVLRDKHGAAKRQIEAALGSVTTVGKLLELWPEIAPFTKDFNGIPSPLPAIPTSDLNALLDLPVAEAA